MTIRPINGMGEPKPVRECDWCLSPTQGRAVHLVLRPPELNDWVCDDCWKGWRG